jgi:hypothetical protein
VIYVLYIYLKHKLFVMKTTVSRSIALLVLAAMGLTSCSTEYRERRRHRHEERVRVHERVIIQN